jgi:UDP-2-acetamido-3-amino-2,3-dideoxy-glucuronate N-acetyltransferase
MPDPCSARYQDLLSGRHRIHYDTRFGKNVRLGEGVVIEGDCSIGDNCVIGHYVILRPGTKIGNDCTMGHHTVFEGDCDIGNRVLIHAQCHITKDVIIEDDVFIAPFFCGANTMRIKHGRDYPLVINGYRIRRAARIAIGVLVLPGVEIGENALIGAGALVTKDVPAGEIWVGVPARKVGDVPEDEIL